MAVRLSQQFSFDNLLLLLIAAVLICSVPAYRYIDRNVGFVSMPARTSGGGEGGIARLGQVNRDVKIKRVKDLDWSAARDSDILYQDDLVRTLANAGAEIQLQRGQTITGVVTVASNSLVKVQAPEQSSLSGREASTIQVTEGDVRVKVSQAGLGGGVVIRTEDGSEVRIQEKRSVGLADSSNVVIPENASLGRAEAVDITIHTEKGKGASIEAHSGSVEVRTSAGQATTIQAGETVQMEQGGRITEKPTGERQQPVGAERPTIQLGRAAALSPSNGARIKNQRPGFSWAPVENAEEYIIEINPASGSGIRVKVKGTQFAPGEKLEPGHYTWRVRPLAGDGTEGPNSDSPGFDISAPEPPKLQITDFKWE